MSKRFTMEDVMRLPKKSQDEIAAQLYAKKLDDEVRACMPTDKEQQEHRLSAFKPRIRQKLGDGMNKTERAFKEWFDKGGWDRFPIDVHPLRFNAISFELANGLRYKPDFTLALSVAVEVKGPWASRDAFPRLKMAARLYPELRWFLATRNPAKDWHLQEILP
jgi:hypothetical protein